VQGKIAVGVVVALLGVFVLGATPTFADSAVDPAATASTCVECCEGDSVCAALAGLADLREMVFELVPEAGTANSLVAKLNAATRSVLSLNITPALNQLDAFGHEVDALDSSGRVFTAVSNILKSKHDTVKNSISNVR
jgi:hypothetical protein